MNRIASLAVVAAFSAFESPVAQADYAEIVGGPTYDASTRTGYTVEPSPWQALVSGTPNTFSGNGFGIASFGKTANGVLKGSVPIKWSAGSLTEFVTPQPMNTNYVWLVSSQGSSDTLFGSQATSPPGSFYDGSLAIRWHASDKPLVLDHGLSGQFVSSSVRAANAAGASVGSSTAYQTGANGFPEEVASRPVRWSAGGTAANLLDVAGTTPQTSTFNHGSATAITSNGTAYGTIYYANPNGSGATGLTAVRWNADSSAVIELDHAAAPANQSVEDSVRKVRDTGVAIGQTFFYLNGSRVGKSPTRWNADGSVTLLDLPSIAVAQSTFNQAFDLNDAGTIVGSFGTSSVGAGLDGLRAVRWDAGTTTATVLGLLGTTTAATTSAWAMSINNAGLSVGLQRSHTTDTDGTAVLWGLDGVAVDLNTFVDPASNWRLVEADSITDDGWVSGIGLYDPDGSGATPAYYRAFLIQVPEPACLGLIGAGVIMLRRRR